MNEQRNLSDIQVKAIAALLEFKPCWEHEWSQQHHVLAWNIEALSIALFQLMPLPADIFAVKVYKPNWWQPIKSQENVNGPDTVD